MSTATLDWSLHKMWAGAEALLPRSGVAKGPQVRVLGVQLAVDKAQAEEVATYYQSMDYGMLPVKAGISSLLDAELDTYTRLAKPDRPEAKNARLVTAVFVLPGEHISEACKYYEAMDYGVLPVTTCERRLLASERDEFKDKYGPKHGYDLIN